MTHVVGRGIAAQSLTTIGSQVKKKNKQTSDMEREKGEEKRIPTVKKKKIHFYRVASYWKGEKKRQRMDSGEKKTGFKLLDLSIPRKERRKQKDRLDIRNY